MRYGKWLPLAAGSAALVGCGSLYTLVGDDHYVEMRPKPLTIKQADINSLDRVSFDASSSGSSSSGGSSGSSSSGGSSSGSSSGSGLPPTKKDYLASVVHESETNCGKFMDSLAQAMTSNNATSDISTTILSSLAAVFTPLTTTHALSAGSAVIGGSKTAVQANIFAKATVDNFQTAMQQTYYAKINDYVTKLELKDEKDIIVGIEVDKIQTIYDTCTLPAAESAITSTIGSSSSSSSSGGAANSSGGPANSSGGAANSSGGSGSSGASSGASGSSGATPNATAQPKILTSGAIPGAAIR